MTAGRGEDLVWCGVPLRHWLQTGVVVSSRRTSTQRLYTVQSSTPVTVQTYHGATPVTSTAWVPTSQVHVRTDHQHVFSVRTSTGQVITVDASSRSLDVQESHKVTIVYVGRARHDSGYAATVVNHSLGHFHYLVDVSILAKWLKLPIGEWRRLFFEGLAAVVLSLVAAAFWAQGARAGQAGREFIILACFALGGYALYLRAKGVRKRTIGEWISRCSHAAAR